MKSTKNIKRIRKILIVIILLVMTISVFANVSKAETEVVDITTDLEFKNCLQNGGNIKLQADITITANVAAREPLIIDLNGHTIDMGGNTLVLYTDLNIKDTTDTSAGKITGSGSFVIQIGSSTATGKLVLDSGNIVGTGNYGVRVIANSKLIINGGEIQSKSYAVYNQGEFEMNGGSVLTTTGLAVQNHINSTLTMNNGTIKTEADYQAINLYGNCTATINGGEVLAPKHGDRYNGNGISAFKNTELTINGGLISSYGNAILGNGSISGNSEGTNAKFNINGGTIISEVGMGIYAPQPNGVTTITGGTITGRTGIEVRAGTLIISGGTLNSNTNELEIKPNTSGSNIFGTAVSVVQHTTKLPIDLQITGGTFKGVAGVYEKNTMDNNQEDLEKITYSISGGDFTATGSETIHVEDYGEDFITGGKYTHRVTDYIKDGYGEIAEDNKVAVYKYVTVKANQGTNGTLTIKKIETALDDGTIISPEETSNDTIQALKGNKIEIVANPQNDYSLLLIKETEDGQSAVVVLTDSVSCGELNIEIDAKYAKAIVDEVAENASQDKPVIKRTTDEDQTKATIFNQLKNDEITSQNINSNDDLVVKLVIKEKEINNEDKAKILSKMSEDTTIVQLYDIYIVVEDTDGNEISRIHEIPDEISFEVNIPEELAKVENGTTRTYSVLREHPEFEVIDNELSNDGKTISFKSNKFSTFALVYDEVEEVQPAPGGNTEEKTEETNSIDELDKTEEGEFSLPITGPITGDNILIWVSIFGISFIVLIIVRKIED
jgi:DNA-binding protein H-NS